MEPKKKIVNYRKYAWKTADPDVAQDNLREHVRIRTTIDSDGDPEDAVTIDWSCNIKRKIDHYPDGQEFTDIEVTLSAHTFPRAFLTGFYKVSIVDQEGTLLPGEYLFACVEGDRDDDLLKYLFTNGSTKTFEDIQLSENPEDKYFVCFEYYITADEKHMADLDRSTNDLSLLLDESLLTDSVLRVSGREIPVHRVILSARWPRFYERYLAGSTDSVVDVGGIELEAFEKLLKCVYSNRIPVSLLHDTPCRDLARTLEQTRLLDQIQTVEQQRNSAEPPTDIPIVNRDERHDSDTEIGISAQESITYRSFTHSTVITKAEYVQSTTSLDSDFISLLSPDCLYGRLT